MNKTSLESKNHTFNPHKDVYYPISLSYKTKSNYELELSDEYDIYEKFHFNMITGKGCFAIADTCEIWLKDFEKWIQDQDNLMLDLTDDIKQFWNMLKQLFVMFDYNNDTIEKLKENNFEEERKFFFNFGNTFVRGFGYGAAGIHYLHIITCHTIEVNFFFYTMNHIIHILKILGLDRVWMFNINK